MGERHRHVEIGDLRVERRAEDRLVEARVARVEHRVGPDATDQLHELLAARGIDALGAEAVGLPESIGHRLGTLERDVGHHDLGECRPPLGDRGKRRPHAPGPDHQDSHSSSVTQIHIPKRPKKMPIVRRKGHLPAARGSGQLPYAARRMASTLTDRPSNPPVERRQIRWPASPSLGRAEFLWVILAGVLLAVLTSWPLVLHMPSRIAPDLGDPVRTAWQVAYVGHAMLHDPLHLFDANVFYPHPAEPRLLRFAARLRTGRVLRPWHSRGARPLQPAVPVRLVAVLHRGLSAGTRARSRQARRRRHRASPSPTRPTA